MSIELGISLAELLAWNDEAAHNWKNHLESNPALLEVACDIGNTGNVHGFARHIWGAELRWAQRLAGLENTESAKGPLDALFAMHIEARDVFRGLIDGPAAAWAEPYELKFDWIPQDQRRVSRRKIASHALFHSQRHYAQLATLARTAGYPASFRGDILFSAAMR
ncbi:MAG TPA: DinB family protein [Terracidiphilus sp.]|nr:DinB family protein [Terracidiphilus sp.]